MTKFYGYILILMALSAIITFANGPVAVLLFLLWLVILFQTLRVIPK